MYVIVLKPKRFASDVPRMLLCSQWGDTFEVTQNWGREDTYQQMQAKPLEICILNDYDINSKGSITHR